MKKAHEESILVVGKIYEVAHVLVEMQDSFLEVPIIPIWHNDKQFNFEHSHYHLDGRFGMSKEVIARFGVKNGKTASVVSDLPYYSIKSVSKVFYKKKKCIRLTTGLPIEEAIAMGMPLSSSLQAILDWQASMKGKSCAGKICPHLKAVMIEKDGVLICPLHNLKGCPKKEIII